MAAKLPAKAGRKLMPANGVNNSGYKKNSNPGLLGTNKFKSRAGRSKKGSIAGYGKLGTTSGGIKSPNGSSTVRATKSNFGGSGFVLPNKIKRMPLPQKP